MAGKKNRREGRPDFAVTYGEVFEIQPFGGSLITMTLRGAQVLALLEAQFGSRQEPNRPSQGNGKAEGMQGVAFLHRESRPNTQPNRTHRR